MRGVSRQRSDAGFGFVSEHERRQAELFFADFIGAPPGPRLPREIAGSEQAEEFFSDLTGQPRPHRPLRWTPSADQYVEDNPQAHIDSVDPHFAPIVESADIRYSVPAGVSGRVTLRISSATYPGTTVFQRDLTAAEKAVGAHTVTWDGSATVGRLAGGVATPAFSPYTVTIVATGGASNAGTIAIQVHDIEITTTAPASDRLNMSRPADVFDVTATVKVKRKNNTGVVTRCAVDLVFSYRDPAGANGTAAATFTPTGGSPLGKVGSATATLFRAKAGWPATSPNSFRTTANVPVSTAAGANQAKAMVTFAPSAAGGDTYLIRATVFAANGTTELIHRESRQLTVWRRVEFRPFEMTGQRHISTHGTDAIMGGFYNPAPAANNTFVEYHLGAVTVIPAAKSVRYIGLWDRASSSMLSWATHQTKLPAETPTAAQTTAANGPAGPARTAARAAIQVKANAWKDRIIAQYNAGITNWAPDAAVPANAMVAVEFEHPKYSVDAPAADGTTSEWTAFPWLTITVEGSTLHPDRRWVLGQGVSVGGRAYVMAGMSAARTRVAIAHEAGHETKNQFPRAQFGGGDHSAAAGLMDTVGSVAAFTARERQLLKGYT